MVTVRVTVSSSTKPRILKTFLVHPRYRWIEQEGHSELVAKLESRNSFICPFPEDATLDQVSTRDRQASEDRRFELP